MYVHVTRWYYQTCNVYIERGEWMLYDSFWWLWKIELYLTDMRWKRFVELVTSGRDNEEIFLWIETIRSIWNQENSSFDRFLFRWKLKHIIPCVKKDLIKKFHYIMMKHFNMEFNFKSKFNSNHKNLSSNFFSFHLVYRFIRSSETNKSNWNYFSNASYSCKIRFLLSNKQISYN